MIFMLNCWSSLDPVPALTYLLLVCKWLSGFSAHANAKTQRLSKGPQLLKNSGYRLGKSCEHVGIMCGWLLYKVVDPLDVE